jgi:hypothetical protein
MSSWACMREMNIRHNAQSVTMMMNRIYGETGFTAPMEIGNMINKSIALHRKVDLVDYLYSL